MLTIRRVGLAILAVAAIVVFFALAPPVPTQSFGETGIGSGFGYGDIIEDAIDTFEVNDVRADTAPKQQVVNGWVARDLLTIQAYQLLDVVENSQPDDRPAALLVIVVLAISLWGMTSLPSQSRSQPLLREPMSSDGPSG